MNQRSYLIMAALTMGLFFQSVEAEAHYREIPQVSDAVLEDLPVEEGEIPSDKVCFCHNVNHNPHTICTANEALINAHMAHVNGENPGVEDSLGVCPGDEVPGEGEEPGDETDQPCDEDEGEEPSEDTEEPGNEDEQPSDETEEPGDEGEEIPSVDEETPADDSQAEIPDTTKVDGFEADGEIAADETAAAGPAAFPAWYFEGSGNMGCSLGGTAGGTTDLAPWALFAAVLMISPLRRIRK